MRRGVLLRSLMSVIVMMLFVAACSSDEPAPTTTVAPAATTTTTEPATTTTTEPATTTTTLPFIRKGTYAVPSEVPAGTYRHRLSAVRLDENMEIIANYLVADPDGIGIVIVQPTDSFISVEAWIITVEDFGRPIDPIAEGLSNGVYLVGYDLAPGRYEVLGDGPGHGWARLDNQMEIIDSRTGGGTLEVVIEASDFAFEYSGVLRLIP